MRAFLIIPSLLLFLFACNNSDQQSFDKLRNQKEEALANDSTRTVTADTAIRDCAILYKKAREMDSIILRAMEVDPVIANKTIRAFTDYAFYCESDSLSPIFLVKTAQIAMAINNPNQAKVVLDRCISNYPKFKNKPAAIFMLAQLYDEQKLLNNEEEAKKLYEKLVFEYPKSEWAANAKAAIKLLGKSDEEIINEFDKKSK